MNIGGYDVGQIFHIGATGPVWRTRTEAGEALLSLRAAGDGERCLKRWKAWASITSRHVVTLRDVARSDDGRWAIVYDFVAGRPLDAEIGSPDLRPIATRRQIIEGIAAGLSALHSAGIVHGDLTPSNIIVTPSGRAVIIDLIDEMGECDGTPGWSQGLSGQGADRACLRQLAHLLHMDEALAELGFEEPNDCLADATPVVDDPVEHPISREPVDPERVIADLRAAALREDTLRDRRSGRVAASTPQNVRGGRQKAQRGRRRALGVLAMGLMAIIAGVSIMAYGLLRSGVSVANRKYLYTAIPHNRSSSRPVAPAMFLPSLKRLTVRSVRVTKPWSPVTRRLSRAFSVVSCSIKTRDASQRCKATECASHSCPLRSMISPCWRVSREPLMSVQR